MHVDSAMGKIIKLKKLIKKNMTKTESRKGDDCGSRKVQSRNQGELGMDEEIDLCQEAKLVGREDQK